MTIYKYELLHRRQQFIPVIGSNAKPIAVAEQHGKLMLWAEVEDHYSLSPKHRLDYSNLIKHHGILVEIVETGELFFDELTTENKYIGTVAMSNGYVWHVYAKGVSQ